MGNAISLPPSNPLLAIEIAKAHFKAKKKKMVISKRQQEDLKTAEVWDKIREFVEVDKTPKE